MEGVGEMRIAKTTLLRTQDKVPKVRYLTVVDAGVVGWADARRFMPTYRSGPMSYPTCLSKDRYHDGVERTMLPTCLETGR